MLALRVFMLLTIIAFFQQSACAQVQPNPGFRPPRLRQIAARPMASPGLHNGLAPTNMDSFVVQAGEHADHIYGDEGIVGISPYDGYEVANRINTGILDRRDAGLTTGHGSYLPDGRGGDEWTGNEWSQSGPTGYKQGDGFPAGLPNITAGSGYTWQGEPGTPSQVGYAPVYGRGNFGPNTSPFMSQQDIDRARQSMLSGDFFNWHGTQSSQNRNR